MKEPSQMNRVGLPAREAIRLLIAADWSTPTLASERLGDVLIPALDSQISHRERRSGAFIIFTWLRCPRGAGLPLPRELLLAGGRGSRAVVEGPAREGVLDVVGQEVEGGLVARALGDHPDDRGVADH